MDSQQRLAYLKSWLQKRNELDVMKECDSIESDEDLREDLLCMEGPEMNQGPIKEPIELNESWREDQLPTGEKTHGSHLRNKNTNGGKHIVNDIVKGSGKEASLVITPFQRLELQRLSEQQEARGISMGLAMSVAQSLNSLITDTAQAPKDRIDGSRALIDLIRELRK